MIEQTPFYRRCFKIATFLFRIFYNLKVVGHENVGKGAAMVCANHSSLLDPIFIGLAFGDNIQLRFVAKAELFKTPIVSWLVKGLGAISTDRTRADITTIKQSLVLLKKGAKVAIFPEGTRQSEDNEEGAKHGAIRIAERAEAPIIPVFLPRKKPLFSKVTIVIGKPYTIARQKVKRVYEDYERLSLELMRKIFALSP